jgi:hypothetical protein
LRCIAISRASIWSFLVIIVASVSSTLGTDTAFFRSATPYWDRRLQPRPDHRIPCTWHRSRNDCNYDRSIVRSIDLPQQHQLHAVIREMKSQLDPTKSKCLFLALAGYWCGR